MLVKDNTLQNRSTFMKRILPKLILACMIPLSCATPKVAYFQDMALDEADKVQHVLDIRVRPGDKIYILVNSKDTKLMELFNLPIVSRQLGNTSGYTAGQGISGYTIDMNGDIDFPVIGSIHVEGMTRAEIASFIKNELVSKNLINDPVITVEFMNLTVSVLGEVVRPGRFNIDRDRLSLIEAISLAGDLTIYGRRDNIIVQREENGQKVFYTANLTSAEELYASPVYYLQQNDVVYVEPNAMRARQSTVNGNNVRSASFWLSLTSLLASLTSSVLIWTK